MRQEVNLGNGRKKMEQGVWDRELEMTFLLELKDKKRAL